MEFVSNLENCAEKALVSYFMVYSGLEIQFFRNLLYVFTDIWPSLSAVYYYYYYSELYLEVNRHPDQI